MIPRASDALAMKDPLRDPTYDRSEDELMARNPTMAEVSAVTSSRMPAPQHRAANCEGSTIASMNAAAAGKAEITAMLRAVSAFRMPPPPGFCLWTISIGRIVMHRLWAFNSCYH